MTTGTQPHPGAARIGVMQGRLSPQVGDRIQAFPAAHWQEEFGSARELGIGMIEWTLDNEGLDDNPLMNAAGRNEIRDLMRRTGVTLPSLTGDCFMQAPFWKAPRPEREGLRLVMRRVIEAGAELGIASFVVPLVDNGRIESEEQRAEVVDVFCAMAPELRARRARIVIESDSPPQELAELLSRLPADVVGVNYDIGNSASLGFDSSEEIAAYGARILNVHVKDRTLGGSTVPLGSGAANLAVTIERLERNGYRGAYILQTARAIDGDHAGAIRRYRQMLLGWLEGARGS